MSVSSPSLWLVVLAGVLVTYVWRLAGVLLVSRIDPDGPALRLVRAVVTALVAALVARMLLFPSGLLAGTPLPARLGAVLFGVAVWRFSGRMLEMAVAAGASMFLALQMLLP